MTDQQVNAMTNTRIFASRLWLPSAGPKQLLLSLDTLNCLAKGQKQPSCSLLSGKYQVNLNPRGLGSLAGLIQVEVMITDHRSIFWNLGVIMNAKQRDE